MRDENKKYWDDFYKHNKEIPKENSDFAEYVLDYIKDCDDVTLIDVACGNGRDTEYFHRNGIESYGVDISSNPIGDANYMNSDILTFDYSSYNVIYMRFITHSLTENQLNDILYSLNNINALIFIEARSIRGVSNGDKKETYFSSSIGENHFRMLYSMEYMRNKLSNHFEILESSESDQYAKFKNDSPYCLRYVCKNR